SQQKYHLELVGPTRKNYHWQAKLKTGFDASYFLIDWKQSQARCPEGHLSSSWTPAIDNRKNEVIKIKFSRHRLSSLSEFEALHPVSSASAEDCHHPTTRTI